MKLNLGCGNDFKYEKGWVNFDITRPCNLIGDMDGYLPFKSKSFELVWASHVLEHRQDLRKLQCELARILKPRGELKVIVPYYLSADAWGDPTHCRAFSEESFLTCFWVGFDHKHMEAKPFIKYGTKKQVLWLFVDMVRNEIPQYEVERELTGRKFNK